MEQATINDVGQTSAWNDLLERKGRGKGVAERAKKRWLNVKNDPLPLLTRSPHVGKFPVCSKEDIIDIR